MTTPAHGASNKTRLQIDLSPEQVATMDNMQEACGIATRKELFNNALSLLEWAIEEVQRDRIIAALNLETERYAELRMPALSHVSRRSRNGVGERRKVEPSAETD